MTIFFEFVSQAKEIKAKINKWNPIQLKSFCTARKTTDKTKRQPTLIAENICKWYDWLGVNIHCICTTHITQHPKKKKPQTTRLKNGQKNKYTFSPGGNTVANMKRCSITLIIREMQIKTTVRHPHIVRMAITKKKRNNKRWWGCGEKATLAQVMVGV